MDQQFDWIYTAILNLPQNPLAPIPEARIIDTTDQAQTSAVPSAGTNQGIAEYSNANFLSEDTIFQDLPSQESKAWVLPSMV
jgi:hypothetical protein